MTGSLTQALSIALSGLQTSSSLISLASKNISNAQTPGYTAKTASTASVDFGSSFGGVEIAGYSRATNQALTTDYNSATSAASYASTQNNYLSQVQTILDSSNNNPTLSNDIAQFSAAWSQYSSAPESSIQKLNVISAAQTLTNDIHTIGAQIGTLATQAQSDISTGVTTLNADLQKITSINQAIQLASTSGQPTVDLQDQLDQLTNQISSYLNVSVQPRANGQIALYTPSGQLLVDGASPQQFTYSNGVLTDSNGTNVTNGLTGGSLQAALGFVSTSAASAASATPGVGTIVKLQAQLSKLVDAFTNSSGGTPSAFATAYTSAVTTSTAVGATQAGDPVASTFFTVSNGSNGQPDVSTFVVNAGLLASTSDLPQTGAQAIANSFNSTATYTASGLSAPSATYAGLTSAILSNFQQAANIVSAQSTAAASQQTYYQQTLSNATGVNIDTELANLVAYQNSYAASAHVISTVNQMMTTLMGILP
jgi:flagellar hook-associated protein 1 FlgK